MTSIHRCIFLNRFVKASRYFSLAQASMKEMPDPLELLTGLQKKEVNAYMEGNCDPFHNKMLKRGCGTKENPTLVPSAFEGRILGCICQDNRFVNFMWLEKDFPKRCECGHWFKLNTVEKF